MTRRDEAALFTVKGVTDCEPCFTSIAMQWEVWRLQPIPQEEGVTSLLGPQLCAIDCGRQYCEPGPGLCCIDIIDFIIIVIINIIINIITIIINIIIVIIIIIIVIILIIIIIITIIITINNLFFLLLSSLVFIYISISLYIYILLLLVPY